MNSDSDSDPSQAYQNRILYNLKKQQLAYDFGQRTEIVTKNRSQNRRPNSLEIVGLRLGFNSDTRIAGNFFREATSEISLRQHVPGYPAPKMRLLLVRIAKISC